MKLTVLVGPPGSGKSTLAKKMLSDNSDLVYINQDSQGRDGHVSKFLNAASLNLNIVVDRMGFDKEQRNRYISIAKKAGYETEIIVLHQPYAVCLDRVLKRIGSHETIVDEKGARSALQLFFTKYERPQKGEADKITFIYPEGEKPKVIVCDLDGTLCNVEHRRHFVRGPNPILGRLEPVTDENPLKPFKKDWKSFFDGIPHDSVNQWCADLLRSMSSQYGIVYCSGRDDNQRRATVEWLKKNNLASFPGTYEWAPLYMRNRADSRRDDIVKEIILDFELLTRYVPYFMIDDRKQVVEMWRRRGFTCLQCDEGDF